MALCRATGSAVACSTPTGSTHIRSPRSNFSAAFRRACVSRTAARRPSGRGQLPQPVQVRRADRPDRRDLLEQPAALRRSSGPELVVDARIVLASCSGRFGARMRTSCMGSAVLCEHLRQLDRPGDDLARAPRASDTRRPRHCARSRSTWASCAIPSRFFLAPLAGYTSLAFRLAVRGCGGLGLATTDLVNARSLIEGRRRALELAETCDEDRPLSIQIYGAVTAEMEQAARWVEAQGVPAVDINMGCPVRKVVKGGGGSALMCQMDRAVDLVGAVVASVKVPVTVKMRLGWDDESLTAPDLARAFEQVGVAGVIIHGRTREQGFKGSVNRAGIRAVVEAVERIPVVANGDIRTIADAAATFAETGCAAISIGRGALANPVLLPPARPLGPHRRARPGPVVRRADRPDVPALPRAGLAPRRAVRLPAVPQDPQVVLPLHPDAPAAVQAAAQPLEPGPLRRGRRHRPRRRPRIPAAEPLRGRTCPCPRGRSTSGEETPWPRRPPRCWNG